MNLYRANRRQAVGGLIVAVLLALWPVHHAQAMLETQEEQGGASDAETLFPLPPALEPAVTFWSNVFGVWQRDQVALHDDEYLGVVYRIEQIPGRVADSLSRDQRTWMRHQEMQLASELRALVADQAAGRPLSRREQELAEAIRRGGGTLRGAAERVRAQRGTRERFLSGLETSGRYDRAFREVFRAQGLPEDLAYLPHVESSFRIGARSSVGAAGIWQFMPSTARLFMAVNRAVDERLNPIAAAQGAARYFAAAYRELGNWPLAVTSYNHGVGSMRRAQSLYGNDFARIVRDYQSPSFGFASRNFYPEFLAARRIAQNPEKYFPEGVHLHAPLAVKPMLLKRSMHAHEISRRTGTRLTKLADLNPGWSDRALTGKSKLPAGITVWLPSGKSSGGVTELAAIEDNDQPTKETADNRHKVVEGDSLWAIARRHGTTVAALSRRNGLDPNDPHLRIGQVLELPPSTAKSAVAASAAVTHRVGPGDTPFGIASIYRVSLHDLLTTNNMHTHSVIYPGQQLLIPSRP